jgi:hypothetical protein
MRKHLIAVSLTAGLLGLSTAHAGYNVYVTGSRPVDTEVMPSMNAMNTTLGEILTTQQEIGAAVNGNSDKVVAMIQETGQNAQEYSSFAQESQNLEHARQSFSVPQTICSESTSGTAAQVSAHSASLQGKLASGSGVSTTAISRTLNTAPVPPEQEQDTAAAIHASYCTTADYAAFGGTTLCPSVSDLPGGDTQARSLYSGAGQPDKTPDLTFSQQQTDAAMMYLKNSARHSVGKQLNKGEARTASGRQYTGLMDEYQSIESAAEQPQLEIIAGSQPDPETKTPLADALQTPSAKSYFDQTASAAAKSSGEMSQREFEAFEVGRRYASPDYQTDLQAMQGDNLMRESIRVQSLQNWLLLEVRQQLAENAVIAGQQLSLAAGQTYGPQLHDKLQQVSAGVSR